MNEEQVSNRIKSRSISCSSEVCCGCGACASICPKDAITQFIDSNGYLLYKVNKEKCVNCGLCLKVCPIQGEKPVNLPVEAFAACSKDKESRKNAASGGVFAAIAAFLLKQGWTVWGAAYENEQSNNVVHTKVSTIKDLPKLQGSKYVQSKTENVFYEIKQDLEKGKKVLFSGTPCQVAALKNYIGKYQNGLVTIDLICHGVPNAEMFNHYIAALEELHMGNISQFSFRDKSFGWGMNASAILTSKNGKEKKIVIPSKNSSYFNLFLNSQIYRQSCYKCPYAQMSRSGDITIGDYWGIEKEHPELLKKGNMLKEEGISCVFINSEKGLRLIQECGQNITLYKTTPKKIAAHNGQLNTPSQKPSNYGDILNQIRLSGFLKLEKERKKELGLKYWINILSARIPKKLKKQLKNVISKL